MTDNAEWWVYDRSLTTSGRLVVKIATKRGRRTSVVMPEGKQSEASILAAAEAAVDALFGRMERG